MTQWSETSRLKDAGIGMWAGSQRLRYISNHSEMGTFEVQIVKRSKGWDKLLKVWVLKLNTEVGPTKLCFYWQGQRPREDRGIPETTDIQKEGIQMDQGGSNFSFSAKKKSQMCFPKFLTEIKETLRCYNMQFLVAYFHFLVLHEKLKCKSQIRTSCLHLVVTEMRHVTGATKQQLGIEQTNL